MSKLKEDLPEIPAVDTKIVIEDGIYKGYQMVDDNGKVLEFVPGREVKIENDEGRTGDLIVEAIYPDIPMPIIYRNIPDGKYKERLSMDKDETFIGNYMITEYKNGVRTKSEIFENGKLDAKERYDKNGSLELLTIGDNLERRFKDGWLTEKIRLLNDKGDKEIEKFYRGLPLSLETTMNGEFNNRLYFRNGCAFEEFLLESRHGYIARIRGKFREDECFQLYSGSFPIMQEPIDRLVSMIIEKELDKYLDGILEISFFHWEEENNKEDCMRNISRGICSKIDDVWTIRRYYDNGVEIPFDQYQRYLKEATEKEIAAGQKIPQIGREIASFL